MAALPPKLEVDAGFGECMDVLEIRLAFVMPRAIPGVSITWPDRTVVACRWRAPPTAHLVSDAVLRCAVASREALYERLTADMPTLRGKELSSKERDDKGLRGSGLVYGEIRFTPFFLIFHKVSRVLAWRCGARDDCSTLAADAETIKGGGCGSGRGK